MPASQHSFDQLEAMAAFVAVAGRLGFAAAARDLGISPAALTRRVGALEAHLGVRLLQRTTRRVALTEAGARYLEQANAILTRIKEADAAVAALADAPRGRLRIALPTAFGQRYVVPLIPEFMALHPEVAVELVFGNTYVDLIEKGIDVAVRVGVLDTQPDLTVRTLAPHPALLVAAPDYLARRGTPLEPEDLSAHDALVFGYAQVALRDRWTLTRNGAARTVPLQPRLTSENPEALRIAVVAGCGVAAMAMSIVGPDLRAGRVVPILTDWALPETSVFVAFPSSRQLAPKVRAFLDHPVGHFQGTPPWDRFDAQGSLRDSQ